MKPGKNHNNFQRTASVKHPVAGMTSFKEVWQNEKKSSPALGIQDTIRTSIAEAIRIGERYRVIHNAEIAQLKKLATDPQVLLRNYIFVLSTKILGFAGQNSPVKRRHRSKASQASRVEMNRFLIDFTPPSVGLCSVNA